MGVVAGGLNDGGVVLWDPEKLAHGVATSQGDVPGAQLSRLSKHTGAVRIFLIPTLLAQRYGLIASWVP
jgi:hypothetical protein